MPFLKRKRDSAAAPLRPAAKKAVALALVLLAGQLLSRVGGEAARWQEENQPAFNAATLEGMAGQGVLLGVFGGFRAIMADFAWLRSYIHWENRERAACETLMRLSIALDPGNLFFWRNTADIIAYDMPHWETAARRRGGRVELDPVVERQIALEYAERGIALHARAARLFPREEGAILAQCALICLRRLNNPRRAAEFYREAAECPAPVWFAALARANILCDELGQQREAAAWLRAHAEKIRAGIVPDPAGSLELLDAKLRELEKQKKS
jgi:hypothetical protein